MQLHKHHEMAARIRRGEDPTAAPDGVMSISKTSFSISPQVFAWSVSGNCLSPYVRDGSFILLDPGRPPMVGDIVALITTDGQLFAKVLVQEFAGPRGGYYLGYYNPSARLMWVPRARVLRLYAAVGAVSSAGREIAASGRLPMPWRAATVVALPVAG